MATADLWEVHGIPGPVVHQFMEVIGEGSFPLVGCWHVGCQTLGTPLALTQTLWTAHCVGAVCPCRGRQRERERDWDIGHKDGKEVIKMSVNAGPGWILEQDSITHCLVLMEIRMTNRNEWHVALDQHLKSESFHWGKERIQTQCSTNLPYIQYDMEPRQRFNFNSCPNICGFSCITWILFWKSTLNSNFCT